MQSPFVLKQAPGGPDSPLAPHASAEARLLIEAFDRFSQASHSLESTFQRLQDRIRRLSLELEEKNVELEQSLAAKDKVEHYLKNILESLPCGVLVLDGRGSVTLSNPVANDLLHLDEPGTGQQDRLSEVRDRLMSAVSDRKGTEELEIPLMRREGVRTLATSGTPLADSEGQSIGTLHIMRDVSEVKSLQEQTRRCERLSAMGEMAVELAHEIRNPLGSIELFASLLERELADDTDPKRWAESIRAGSRSLNNIVSNMLQFANPFNPNFEAVQVHALVDEILGFANAILRQRDIQVEKNLEATEDTLYGDRELLKQMLLNLILNSMQALPSHGFVKISSRELDALPGGVPCKGLQLRIQDSGLGISKENLGRIFDPFFTTHRKGTGLGLSVVHQIVEQHSGSIHVESEVGVGTQFTIVLPSSRIGQGAA